MSDATDERRAKELARVAVEEIGIILTESMYQAFARAIRASDEAAGVRLVPREMPDAVNVAWAEAYANSDRDIAERLADVIIADAFGRGWITDGLLAERLIRERQDARDEILRLRAALTAARDSASGLGWYITP